MVAVPHAGRDYPAALLNDARVPQSVLSQLEDRFADRLVEPLADKGAVVFIAERARAWLDLNRGPREIDPAMIAGPPPRDLQPSPRVRGGLGLIPRRAGSGPLLWRRPLPMADIEARIADYHRPYHAALAEALESAKAQYGMAILIDCHSMPSLRAGPNGPAPTIVIGDRFGTTASPVLSDAVAAIARSNGHAVARNHPYAGGYTVEHHGRPGRGLHAIQIEIDRCLYLDAALDQPGSGLKAMQAMLAAIYTLLANTPESLIRPLAAE